MHAGAYVSAPLRLRMGQHCQQSSEPAASYPVPIHYYGLQCLARGVLPGNVSMLKSQVGMQGSENIYDYLINYGTGLKLLRDTRIRRVISLPSSGLKGVRVGNFSKSISSS